MIIEPTCNYTYNGTSSQITEVVCSIDISAFVWFAVFLLFLLAVSIIWRH